MLAHCILGTAVLDVNYLSHWQKIYSFLYGHRIILGINILIVVGLMAWTQIYEYKLRYFLLVHLNVTLVCILGDASLLILFMPFCDVEFDR